VSINPVARLGGKGGAASSSEFRYSCPLAACSILVAPLGRITGGGSGFFSVRVDACEFTRDIELEGGGAGLVSTDLLGGGSTGFSSMGDEGADPANVTGFLGTGGGATLRVAADRVVDLSLLAIESDCTLKPVP